MEVKQAFIAYTFHPEAVNAILVLIPKKPHPTSCNDLRPIALNNFRLKVISKIIIERLKPYMNNLIDTSQSAFIPGRKITDNILLVQEMFHTMNNPIAKDKTMALKVNLSKAYDGMGWAFIHDTLEKAHIPPNLIILIMTILISGTTEIAWEGEELRGFHTSRGVCQGDPLSPYIFVLCMDRLSQAIHELVWNGSWKPATFSSRGPQLSHGMFADDLILF